VLIEYESAHSAGQIKHAALVIMSPTNAVPNEPTIPGGDVSEFPRVALGESQRKLIVGYAGLVTIILPLNSLNRLALLVCLDFPLRVLDNLIAQVMTAFARLILAAVRAHNCSSCVGPKRNGRRARGR
jgi:hypothetical protein